MSRARLALATLLVGLATTGGAAPALRELDVRLPSPAARPGSLAVRVTLPAAPRYPSLAPVAVVVGDGWDAGTLMRPVAPLAAHGFIELRFCYPGEGDLAGRSDGSHDQRGAEAVRAVADVAAFALGRARTVDGRTLAQIAEPCTPYYLDVGLLALGNGGNTAILALARHADLCGALAWLATWETPVGDAAAVGLYGSRRTGPNPAYNPLTGQWDPASLAYESTHGLYEDLNHNGRADNDEFVLHSRPAVRPDGSLKSVLPTVVAQAAEARHAFGPRWPSTVLDPAETAAYWTERNAAGSFELAVAAAPKLLAMVLAGQVDHEQVAPDHPHVLAAYAGWRQAGLGWVRLNPDASYVAAVAEAGAAPPLENPANAALDRATLASRLMPATAVPPALLMAAGAMELADRVKGRNREADLAQRLN